MAEPLSVRASEVSGAAGAALPRVHRFDERRLDFEGQTWPVESPPFAEPGFRTWQHALQFGAMRAATRSALALPGPLRRALIASVAALGRRFDRRHTAAALEFVGAALPELDDAARAALVAEAWRHLLRVALATEGVQGHILGRRLGDCYEVYAAPEVEAVLAAPGGCVFVTAHVGYWELSPPAVTALLGRPTYAVGKAPRNDYVAEHILRMREAQGMRLVPRRGAMQVVPAALRAGAAVGLLLDHRPWQRPVFAPFFGRPAACDRSAGVLLRRVAAPIVFYGCYGTDEPWRFQLRFTRLVQPDEIAGLGPEAIATLVNRELEALVLHRPAQYFWLHDRYRDAPASLTAAEPPVTHADDQG